MDIKKQTGSIWIDSKGLKVERKRISKYEVLSENAATNIAKKAVSINKELAELANTVKKFSDQVIKQFCLDNNLNEIGGPDRNHVYYSFDKQIKIVHNVVENVEYDPNQMVVAYEKIKDFVSKKEGEISINSKMLLDALKSTKGRYDNRKVNIVLSYKNHDDVINDPDFQAAIASIEKAKKITGEKIYDRIYVKNEDGNYEHVPLSFANIQNKEANEL